MRCSKSQAEDKDLLFRGVKFSSFPLCPFWLAQDVLKSSLEIYITPAPSTGTSFPEFLGICGYFPFEHH
jgi:hypothetical protein